MGQFYSDEVERRMREGIEAADALLLSAIAHNDSVQEMRRMIDGLRSSYPELNNRYTVNVLSQMVDQAEAGGDRKTAERLSMVTKTYLIKSLDPKGPNDR